MYGRGHNMYELETKEASEKVVMKEPKLVLLCFGRNLKEALRKLTTIVRRSIH